MVTRVALNLNGISIAYVMGLANAVFACLVAFGISLSDQEIGAVMGLLNALLIMAVHFGHRVGEATATGASQAASAASMQAHEPPPEA